MVEETKMLKYTECNVCGTGRLGLPFKCQGGIGCPAAGTVLHHGPVEQVHRTCIDCGWSRTDPMDTLDIMPLGHRPK